MSDDHDIILDGAAGGDEDAFGELVRRHQAALRGFISRFLVDPEEVFDRAQEVFLQAYRSMDRFDRSQDFGRWLRGIAMNVIRQHLRSESRRRARLRRPAETRARGAPGALRFQGGTRDDDPRSVRRKSAAGPADRKRLGRHVASERPGGGPATAIRSEIPAERLVEACRRSHEISVAAWIRPHRTRQVENSRILSLSAGPSERNFALGQNDAGANPLVYSFRLRTQETGVEADRYALRSPGQTSKTVLTQLVTTRAADGMARLYLDGKEVASRKTAGDLSMWSRDCRLLLAHEVAEDPATSRHVWLGDYYALAIYARALTAEEVAEHYRAGTD